MDVINNTFPYNLYSCDYGLASVRNLNFNQNV